MPESTMQVAERIGLTIRSCCNKADWWCPTCVNDLVAALSGSREATVRKGAGWTGIRLDEVRPALLRSRARWYADGCPGLEKSYDLAGIAADAARDLNEALALATIPTPREEKDEAASRLRAFVQQQKPGGCRWPSLGSACTCPLCDIDRLRAVDGVAPALPTPLHMCRDGHSEVRFYGDDETSCPVCYPALPSAEWVGLTFETFSLVNRARSEAPDGFHHRLDEWSTAEWFTAIMGELGEAANVAKKLNRVRDGWSGNKESPAELREKLTHELADVFIYLDLIFQSLGHDLAATVVQVFNAKSEQIGYAPRLALVTAPGIAPEEESA